MGDKFNGEDPYGLLRGIKGIYNGNQRKHARYTAWDQWDIFYGCGKLDYEVYILTDLSKPGIYKFGSLEIYHEPFYVGQGKINRHKASAEVGRQRDQGGRKIRKLEEMKQRNKQIKKYIVKNFYTRYKANVVELKLLNLYIDSLPTNFVLTNSDYKYCDIPLHKKDYIQPFNILTI